MTAAYLRLSPEALPRDYGGGVATDSNMKAKGGDSEIRVATASASTSLDGDGETTGSEIRVATASAPTSSDGDGETMGNTKTAVLRWLQHTQWHRPGQAN